MSNVLLINVTGHETRVALVENGVLAEFYVERKRDRGIVGNIYKGRVVRILPGMQAAFVDIGTDRSAFLYVSEVLNEHFSFTLDEGGPLLDDVGLDPSNQPTSKSKAKPTARIEDLLKEGQEILVQAAKDPIGTKGARLTCHITMPGRFLVFMPTVNHIGISRRISAERERRRLRDLTNEMRPEGSGFIVRTAAAAEPEDHLRQDMSVLIGAWQDVLDKRDQVKAPACLHQDFDLVLRATRDLVSTNIDRIVVDSPDLYRRIPAFIRRYMPGFYCSIELYQGAAPVFEAFGIELELDRALGSKVWLKSGGYLVIDQTEALTAIDVNTGKFVGKTSLEETITKTNLEAVEEIVYQLRLRSIGGLIVLDLIDMDLKDNRDKVYQALVNALEQDKARTNITQISDFGLVEMTRKRVQESLVQQLCEPCPYCEGMGRIKAETRVAYDLLRTIKRHAKHGEGHVIDAQAHPGVIDYLKRHERDTLQEIEASAGVEVRLRKGSNLHRATAKVELDAGKGGRKIGSGDKRSSGAKPKAKRNRGDRSRRSRGHDSKQPAKTNAEAGTSTKPDAAQTEPKPKSAKDSRPRTPAAKPAEDAAAAKPAKEVAAEKPARKAPALKPAKEAAQAKPAKEAAQAKPVKEVAKPAKDAAATDSDQKKNGKPAGKRAPRKPKAPVVEQPVTAAAVDTPTDG